MRKNKRSEQLRLEFEFNYLEWLDLTGEHYDSYEKITNSLYKTQTARYAHSPIIKEISRKGN